MNSEEARRIALNAPVDLKWFDYIKKNIERAVKDGLFYINHDNSLHGSLVKWLEDNGYKVDFHFSIFSTNVTISW